MYTLVSKLVALSVEKYYIALTETQLKICSFHDSLSQKGSRPLVYGLIALQKRLWNLLSQGLSFKACKLYITTIFTHLVAKLHKNKNLRFSFKATADAAVKGKI